MEKRVGETSFRKVLNGLVAAKAATAVEGKDIKTEPQATPAPSANTTTNTNNANNNNAANNGTMPKEVDQTLSTKKLLKTIKLETGKNLGISFCKLLLMSLAGQDVKSFAEKWVYGKGCPKFMCGFWFNRKRHQTEFALRQATNKPEERISR